MTLLSIYIHGKYVGGAYDDASAIEISWSWLCSESVYLNGKEAAMW